MEAVDGEDALAVCREHGPDVILLDVEMPRLDGHGVLAALQRSPELADIPVVFLTARTTTEDVVEGLRLGAHDYLRKPFEAAELLARVSAALRVKTLQDELRQRQHRARVPSAARTRSPGCPTGASCRNDCSHWRPPLAAITSRARC